MRLIGVHRQMTDVKVRRGSPSLCHIELLRTLVKANHFARVEDARRILCEHPTVQLEIWIALEFSPCQCVGERIAQHSCVQICIAQPLRCFANIRHRAEYDFSIEIVRKRLDELTLDRRGMSEEREVVGEALVLGENDAFSGGVKLRTTCSSENLLNVENAQIFEATVLRIVQLSALDNHRVRREIDTPGQRCCAHKHLDSTVAERTFHERTVRSQHAGVVHTESVREKLLHLAIATAGDVAFQRCHRASSRSRHFLLPPFRCDRLRFLLLLLRQR
mmetsp:Transcript_30774/g.100165  ORF Transcript_30774/g.100165 Transcript_30774/m.100165 type:complete len:276 (-) Transcript_30774:2176-3003(-)